MRILTMLQRRHAPTLRPRLMMLGRTRCGVRRPLWRSSYARCAPVIEDNVVVTLWPPRGGLCEMCAVLWLRLIARKTARQNFSRAAQQEIEYVPITLEHVMAFRSHCASTMFHCRAFRDRCGWALRLIGNGLVFVCFQLEFQRIFGRHLCDTYVYLWIGTNTTEVDRAIDVVPLVLESQRGFYGESRVFVTRVTLRRSVYAFGRIDKLLWA